MYPIVLLFFILGQALAQTGSSEVQKGFVVAPDSVHVHYSSYGTGLPALVFVHGISCDQSYWHKQIAPFYEVFQVVTVDLAGHGKSGMGRNEWSMAAYGADVSAVVKSLNLQKVVLIGHSMGAAVVLEAVRQLPDRVEGLVLVDAFDDFSTWYTDEENEEFLEPFRTDLVQATDEWIRSMFRKDADPELVEQIVTDMSSAPREVFLPSLEFAVEAMFGKKRTTLLENLETPVVVINSDNGPTEVESMQRQGVEVHIFSGTGHFLMMENSDSFNTKLTEVIGGFLD